jgi:hypothetical protein
MASNNQQYGGKNPDLYTTTDTKSESKKCHAFECAKEDYKSCTPQQILVSTTSLTQDSVACEIRTDMQIATADCFRTEL